MNLKHTYLFILFLFTLNAFGQGADDDRIPVSECQGAINIFENEDYSVQFTGKNSTVIEKAYPSLQDKVTGNQIWCSYVAAEDGNLEFTAEGESDFIKMVIFKQERNDLCGEIGRGISEIQRLQVKDSLKQVGLSKNTGNGIMYSLALNKGEKIMVMFSTTEKSKQNMKLHWNFITNVEVKAETKVIDLREDDFAPTLYIKIRDKETKQPLIGNLTIEGQRDLAALYVGSDFYFNVERRCKLMLKCNVEGYFFRDIEVPIEAMKGKEVTLELDKVSKGKKILLEEIEFVPGTSEIMSSSEPKLKRLRDFLALNSDIEIEIQGHVHLDGEHNTFGAQRMSEARAKRVMKYLIDNGIDKSRLTAVGFGNTQPIYEDPKFSYEEQANRRVEIMIK